MGLFWDLMQQSQLSNQDQRTQTVENRVQRLEREVRETRELLHKLISVLEREYGKDLDGDGRVG
ncbi:MAG: chaperonin cofactor prefoldin [Candidatus Binatia bacterium]|jgi:chaperonin cofactor prefoldin